MTFGRVNFAGPIKGSIALGIEKSAKPVFGIFIPLTLGPAVVSMVAAASGFPKYHTRMKTNQRVTALANPGKQAAAALMTISRQLDALIASFALYRKQATARKMGSFRAPHFLP